METQQAMPPESVGEIAAHVDYFGVANEAEVVLRLGHDLDAWRSGRERIDQAISAPRRHRDPVVTRAYAVSFAKALARLEEESPEITSLGPVPEQVSTTPIAQSVSELAAPVAHSQAIEASMTEAPARPIVAKPSYLVQRPANISLAAQARDVDETLPIPDPRLGIAAAPLPFRPGSPTEASVRRPPRVIEPDPDAGETVVTLADGMTPVSTAAMPSVRSVAVPRLQLPTISLEEYAAILAELANAKTSPEEVWLPRGFAREEDRRAVEKAFRQRFDNDPRERARLAELIKHYRATLKS